METSKRKTIFIVDDDIVYLEIIKNELEQIKNADVEVFTSAENCLLQMHKKPDIIILDFYLDTLNPRNMNGHEALRELLVENPKQKILFISSSLNEFLLEEYRRYKSIDYLIKTDFGATQIQQIVNYHLAA